MKAYQVLVNGRNFRLRSGDTIEHVGFFTTRIVVAPSREEAEAFAVHLLREDEWLKDSTLNDPEDPPRLFVDEIEELQSVPEDFEEPGFMFYPASEDEEPS